MVHPGCRQIDGLECYLEIAAPAAPEMPIIAVTVAPVRDTIAALGAKGCPVAVVFSSGFAELGLEGKALRAFTPRHRPDSSGRDLGDARRAAPLAETRRIVPTSCTWCTASRRRRRRSSRGMRSREALRPPWAATSSRQPCAPGGCTHCARILLSANTFPASSMGS